MPVKRGPAKKRQSRRQRPPGVEPAAKWNARRKRWELGDFWFKESSADSAVEFFEDYLVFTKGKWAGKPFLLEPWESDQIIRPLFGWKRADGTRRYRRCYVWVPRKNGKTELAAGIALLLLIGDAEDGGEVYSIASNKDQARIVFNQATQMVNKSPTLNDDLLCFKTSIYCPELNAGFQPLSGKAEGKHGYNVSGLIGDEIHEWADGDLYQFMHDSQDAREQPLEFLISTAGKKGTYGEEVWDECVKIRDGTIEDPETLVVIFAADPDDDWQDEATWKKANPNLGVSKKLDTMRTQRRDGQDRCARDSERHQLADDSYMDEGIELLKLAKNAHRFFALQPPGKKSRMLSFLVSNCSRANGELSADFKQHCCVGDACSNSRNCEFRLF